MARDLCVSCARRQVLGRRPTSNDYATHRELLPNCSLEGHASHGKMGGIDHLETDTADKIFSLLWLPHEVEMVRHRTVCRNVNPHTAIWLAKVKKCPEGLLGFFKML